MSSVVVAAKREPVSQQDQSEDCDPDARDRAEAGQEGEMQDTACV